MLIITLSNTLRFVPRTHKMPRKVLEIRYIVLIPRNISLSKFSVVSVFSNMHYGKKQKPGNAGNRQKAFKVNKVHSFNGLPLLKNC